MIPTSIPPIVRRDDSGYFRRYGRYFDSRASYGRAPDTIIYFAFKTPTGKWSRAKWATLRFNSERKQQDMMARIIREYNHLFQSHKSDIKKGYRIAEIVLYSGEIV